MADQVPDLVAVQFGDRRNAVDVADEVFRRSQERPERSLALAATEQVATACRLEQLPQLGLSLVSERTHDYYL